MDLSNPKLARAAAEIFCRDNLRECCAELVEWSRTALLCDGKLRELAKLCGHYISEHDALKVAERMVQQLACESVCSAPAAGTDQDAEHSPINNYVVGQAQANAVRGFAQAMVECGIVSSAISTAFLDCAEKCAERIVDAAIAAHRAREGA